MIRLFAAACLLSALPLPAAANEPVPLKPVPSDGGAMPRPGTPQNAAERDWIRRADAIIEKLEGAGAMNRKQIFMEVSKRMGKPPTKKAAAWLDSELGVTRYNTPSPGRGAKPPKRRDGEPGEAPPLEAEAGGAAGGLAGAPAAAEAEQVAAEQVVAEQAQQQVRRGLASGGAHTMRLADGASGEMQRVLPSEEDGLAGPDESGLDAASTAGGAANAQARAPAGSMEAKPSAASGPGAAAAAIATASNGPGLTAAMRFPSFYSHISRQDHAQLKDDVRSRGVATGAVLRDVGLTSGEGDLEWSRSCSKVSGDCNRLSSAPSYRRGDFIAPQDLHKMWKSIRAVEARGRGRRSAPGAQAELPDLDLTPEEEDEALAAIGAVRPSKPVVKPPTGLAGLFAAIKRRLAGGAADSSGAGAAAGTYLASSVPSAWAGAAGARAATPTTASRPKRALLVPPQPPSEDEGRPFNGWLYALAGMGLALSIWRVVRVLGARRR